MEEVGRKLYLSETPSIGWEAKTLGAKRRISSSEIATVPGTVVSAVLMLVDWLVGCSEPQQKGEALGAAGVFSTFGFGSKKYAWHIFRAESEALAEAPRIKAGKRKSPANAGVEDLNGRCRARLTRRGGEPFKPQTVLLRFAGLRGFS
jgi:hypothetical protein